MEDTNLPANEAPKKPVRKTAPLPASDIDLGAVSETVSEKWTASPWLTLLWTDEADFAAKAATFNSTLEDRNTTGAQRPQYTRALELLDKKIEEHLGYVKGYVIGKFHKEAAKSYYPSFGLQFRKGSYELPRDQNRRSAALKLMKEGIAAHGFSDEEFGLAFWTSVKTEYDTLLQHASDADSAVSKSVGGKNVLEEEIRKTLNALIRVIQGNYPDTFAEELRAWGFQKEKY